MYFNIIPTTIAYSIPWMPSANPQLPSPISVQLSALQKAPAFRGSWGKKTKLAPFRVVGESLQKPQEYGSGPKDWGSRKFPAEILEKHAIEIV